MRLGMALAIALAPLAAGDAGAQEAMRIVEDSTPLPADTVRVTLTWVRTLERCDPPHPYVVRDSADVAWLRRWTQCADADFGDLSRQSLAFLTLFGDCHASYLIEAWRSESRRALLVRVAERGAVCRAGLYHFRWLGFPSLPEGWTVRLSETRWGGRDEWNPPPLPHPPGAIRIPSDVELGPESIRPTTPESDP